MKNIIKAIREYLILRRMIREKESALFETERDIEFFEICKGEYVNMTVQGENDMRKELQQELNKAENKKDNGKIRRLSNDIQEYKKVQGLYAMSKRTRDELKLYLNLLRHGNKD